MGILRFHTQLYKDSKEHHHAGLPETKSGAKYLKIMHNKVCSVASTNNNLKMKVSLEKNKGTKNNKHIQS